MLRSLKGTTCLAAVALVGLPGIAFAQTPPTSPLIANYTNVTEDQLINPVDGEWLMWRRNYGNWGYSPLDQINTSNVANLELAWGLTMEPGAQETTPLIHDGIMFLEQAYNFTQAVDATTGDILWQYRREQVEHAAGLAAVARNAVLFEDKIILATHDAYLVALDARSGQVVWEQQVGDWTVGHHYSGGPQIFNGQIVAGMSGCYYINPGGCWISAHDTETGEELWRTYTIPRPGEEGDETWNGVPLENRYGGSAWNAGAYDPQANLIYYGVAVPIPWGQPQRGTGDGDVLYTNSTLALNGDTGEIEWYFQYMPNETWDLDHPFARMIVDTPINVGDATFVNPNLPGPETRRVVTGIPGKTGVVWTLDAATGDFIYATDTVYQNVLLGVDAENRRGIVNDELRSEIGETVFVCPHLLGGINWQAPAYSPDTNMIYAPVNNTCMDFTLNEVQPTIGAHHGSARSTRLPVPDSDGNVGSFTAVNVETGEIAWRHNQRAGFGSPVLTTGGGLVFAGDNARRFRAYDAATGDILWEQILSTTVGGFSVSYEVDGRQYIAIPAGGGSNYRSITPEIVVPGGGNVLYVFSLDE